MTVSFPPSPNNGDTYLYNGTVFAFDGVKWVSGGATAYATAAQGATADTALQPGDNVSDLINDAGYITVAEVPGNPVTSVNTQTGDVTLDADDISDATTTNKFTTQGDIDKLAGIEAGATADQTLEEIKAAYESNLDTNVFTDAEQSKLAGIEAGAEVNTVDSVAGKTGDVTLVKADVTDFSDSDYATAAQGLLADSATQPGDNISTLTNDAGYITLAEVPADGVTSVNTQTGAVVLDADDISDAATANKFATQAELDKLAGIEAGAQVNTVTSVNGETGAVTVSGSTDLSYTASTRELASSTGNNVTLPEAVASGDSGLLSGADKATIDGLATVATSGDYTDLTNTPAAGLSLTGDDLIIQLPGYFGTVDGNGTEQNENIRIGQPYYNSTAKRGGDQIVITDSEGWATLEHVNCSNFGVAIGRGFDRFNTTGAAVEQNVLIGDNAGGALSSGDGDFYHNTVIGFEAGASLRGSYENVLIGMQAGYGIDVTTGTGYYASVSPASGAVRNTFLGYQAGYDINNGDNNIAIGYQAGRASSPSGALEQSSNVVVLGNNSINNFYCADTSISSSDARDKTDIEDFTPGLSFIQALRPVTYRWDKRAWYMDIDNPDEDILDIEPTGEHKREKLHLGFIAQEMEAVEQAHGFANDKNDQLIVNLNEDDTAYGVKYERLVPVLVNAIKELKAEIEELKSGINS